MDRFAALRVTMVATSGASQKKSCPTCCARVMLAAGGKRSYRSSPSKTYSSVVCDVNGELRARLDGLWERWQRKLTAGILPRFEEFSEVRPAGFRPDTVLESVVAECEEQDVPVVVFSAHVEPVRAVGGRGGGHTSTVPRRMSSVKGPWADSREAN